MRRAALRLTLGLLFASLALAQESSAGEPGDPLLLWKWVNFAILAGGLGYLIVKNAPGLFRKRSDEIEHALAEGLRVSKEAQAKAAGVELRLSGLQTEIENLRQSARAEMAAVEERLRRETAHRLQRIQDQALQEIALMARAARDELRKYSAELAIDLAAQRIRSRMTKDAQEGLVDGFVQDLRYQVTQRART